MSIAKPQPAAGAGETTGKAALPGQGLLIRAARLPRLRMIQIALGVLWLVDGALQFQPYMFSADFLRDMAVNAQGQPGFIHATIITLVQVAMPYRVLFNASFAVVQVVIGLGLIVSPRTVRPALVLSFGWALVVWWVGEGLGLLFASGASPLTGAPGAVLLYALIGVLVWPAAEVPGAAHSVAAVRDLAGRVAWGSLWLLLAALMLLPFNSARNATQDTFSSAASSLGSGPLAALDTALAHLTAGRGLLVSVIAAWLMAEVGIMVLVDWHRNAALVAGAAIGVFLFLTSQFVGGILSGQGTDPNTGPLLVLFAALLWVRPLSVTRFVPWGRRPVPEPAGLGRVHHG